MKHRYFFLLMLGLICCTDLSAQISYNGAYYKDSLFKIVSVSPNTNLIINGENYGKGDVIKLRDAIWGKNKNQSVKKIIVKGLQSHELYCFSRDAFQEKYSSSYYNYILHNKASSRAVPDILYGVEDREHFPYKRIALVVGNSNYSYASNLVNPIPDTDSVCVKLRQLGFDVILLRDVKQNDFENSISYFYELAKMYEIALFYYAGHGIQDKNINYLVPCDVNTAKSTCRDKLISVNMLLDEASRVEQCQHIFFFDACRVPTSWNRAVSVIKQEEPDTGVGIMYSTQSGQPASDGDGDNSPFATAFITHISSPNVRLEDTMTNIKYSVLSATDSYQKPIFSCNFEKEFYLSMSSSGEHPSEKKIMNSSQTAPKATSAVKKKKKKGNTTGPVKFSPSGN